MMKPLTEHIRRWHKRSDRKPGDDAGAIHPSSLDACNRRIIYKFRGLPRDLEHNEFKQKIFFHGYRIEDWMNEALADQGLLITKNVPVRAIYDGIPTEGTIDHIIRWPLEDPDGWCIADTKSVSDHAFKHQSFPYGHHCLQVGAYQWGLGEMLSLDIDKIERLLSFLLPEEHLVNIDALTGALADIQQGGFGPQYPPALAYIGRGNLKELWVTAGDNAMHQALEKLKEVRRYIKQKVCPPRPFETPEEHPYLCSSCIKRGYQRKDGTYSTEPLYKPNCEYFRRCWDVLPVEWNFWREVAGRERS